MALCSVAAAAGSWFAATSQSKISCRVLVFRSVCVESVVCILPARLRVHFPNGNVRDIIVTGIRCQQPTELGGYVMQLNLWMFLSVLRWALWQIPMHSSKRRGGRRYVGWLLADCCVVFCSEEVNTWLSGYKLSQWLTSTDIMAGRIAQTLCRMIYNDARSALVLKQIVNRID